MSYISDKILKLLEEGALMTAEITSNMMCSKTESYKRFKRSLSGYVGDSEAVERKADKRSIQNAVDYLRRSGFIRRKKGVLPHAVWSITPKGILRILNGKGSKKEISNKKEKSDALIIVSFDIPERFGIQRRWLRETLKLLDFGMIQKSVWVGKYKIPEEFIDEMKRREILRFVEIFEVGKKGTLSKMI